MVTAAEADAGYMRRALALAERARGRTSPNPMVGAVVVASDGALAGEGYHERAGTAHAEVRALDAAGARARGGTLYSTLEPCSHTGRTPPCVERIVAAGVSRVVAGLEDPNPLVSGRGFSYLRSRGLLVEVGVCAAEASRLNEAFFTWVRAGRPFVIVKAALSREGAIAARTGARTRLTSAAADRMTHQLRAEVDAVAVGSGTILADDPLLTARGVARARPLTRVVFDRRLRMPPGARVLSTIEAGPVIIVTSEAGLREGAARAARLASAGALVEVAGDASIGAVLARLARREILSLLLEGGPTIHAAAWQAGVVDRVMAWVTPVTLRGGVPWLADRDTILAGLRERRETRVGPDLLIEGYVHRAD